MNSATRFIRTWATAFLRAFARPATWVFGVGLGLLMLLRSLDRGAILHEASYGLPGLFLDLAGYTLIGVPCAAAAVACYLATSPAFRPSH